MKGLVSSIKHTSNAREDLYYVMGAESDPGLHCLKSDMILHPGEEIVAKLDGDRIIGAEVSEGQKEKYIKAAEKKAKTLVKKQNLAGVSELDVVTKKMDKKIRDAARLFLTKLLTGTPTIVRFHNDSDGSCGAYGLYRCIMHLQPLFKTEPRIVWQMHRGVSYSAIDASEDVLIANNYECIEKPLLFITDFGTSPESNSGIEQIKDRFEVIWLDHHPIMKEFEGSKLEHYINPWNFGGDSNYTAGFLTCTLARSFASVDLSTIEDASFMGDYSSHAKHHEDSAKLAMLIDLITSDKSVAISSMDKNLTPMEIDSIVNNRQKFEELLNYAANKLSESLDAALQSVRQYKSELANVYVVDFQNVRKEDQSVKYPLPGRFASKLLERIETLSEKPAIVVLHFGYFISMRVSTKISEAVDIPRIAAELKEEYKIIESAGGHKSATSIKLRDEDAKKNIINALLRKMNAI